MRKFVFVAVAVTMSVVAISSPASAAVPMNQQEQEFVAKINDLRTANGVAPLAVDDALSSNAQHWAQVQADRQRLSHQLLASTMLNMNVRAENVAFGHDIPAMHDRLVASPLHRNNLLNPAFNRVGVGVRSTATGGMFVTQGFGAA